MAMKLISHLSTCSKKLQHLKIRLMVEMWTVFSILNSSKMLLWFKLLHSEG